MHKQTQIIGFLATKIGGFFLGLLTATIIACPILLDNSDIAKFWLTFFGR